ncbi:MAG: endoglucanase [Gammaproteobacteria bacterium]|nr:MAG: endoglucanase [Gammaproteobacteria bacterium]
MATKRAKSFMKLTAALGLFAYIGNAAAVPAITTSGNKVLFGGQPGSISGNSLFWSNTGWGGEKYYTGQTVSWLKSDWKSNVIRASMGVDDDGGYLTDSSNKTRVTTVVDAAIANDMYAIIDWHSHHAEQYQSQSIAFFKEMASKYGNTNNVIYEIYNEPLQISWSGVIKPYAQAVIAAIRSIDPDNLIIVGTPSWSQDVDVAANDPITGYANIAYTLHFYAGTHGQYLRDKASTALSRGIPLFVTEWGSVGASGDGAVATSETNAWVSFMKANNISNANWALNDKAEGASALVSGASANGGWSSSQLTASGALAKSITSGWPALNQTTSSSRSSVISSSSSPRSSLSSSSRSSSSLISSSRSSVVSSSRSSTVSSSSRSSSSVSGGASCKQVVSSEWGNGYSGAIRITNNRSTAINGWSISWQFSDGTKITNSWNANVSGSNPYSASNLSWNGTIQPGQSVEFGYNATKGGSSVNTPTISGSVCN